MNALPRGEDPVRQIDFSRNLNTLIEPNLVIEGISEFESDGGVPDTNGDVSPDHYFQIINASWFRIWDKEGNPLTPVTSANTIWGQINQQSFSDPIVMWDEAAGRWLLTDLANIDVVLYGISETADPLGAWNLYTLNTPGFADYPKYGIWPNAYLLTINEGQGTYPVYALNRQQMLNGESTVDVQRIEITGLNGGFPTATPMDWNSPIPPPTDEVFVVRLNDDAWGNGNPTDEIEVWSINIDWENPSNTTFSGLSLPTVAYDSDGCSAEGSQFACIPQPGTAASIDGIMTIIMNNVAYWNYGTHESAVLTFSVDAGGDVAGVRWMELRRLPGETWTIYQEGTFAPADGVHRFIGGIAINGRGDIGLAYCVSGENTFPGLRFTGRRAEDPLGEMTVEEHEFAPGSGIRQGTDRYGDYARMAVDPVDGSFWFTSEYTKSGGFFGTKIVNFSLRRDTFDITPTALLTPMDSPNLTNNETVSIEVQNIGLEPATNISVGYVFENNAPVTELATIDTLFPDSVYLHSFGPTVDMSAIGDYNFKVFATFAQDQNTQNDTLRWVRSRLPRYDAGITNVEGLDETLCDSMATATLTLTNFGTETLTSATIQYQLNGGTIQTQNWTGNLTTGNTTNVSITLSPLVTGANTLAVNTSNPNGIADEIPSNDSYSRDFQALLGGVTVTLSLTFDFFSEETSWQLQNESGDILYTGNNYAGLPEQTINIDWCLLEEECYKFVIFDAYGDGLEGLFGPDGTYSILDAEGNTLASILNVNFGSTEENEFCVGTPCSLAADFDVTHESSSNSSDGAILVTPTSGTSPFMYSLNGGTPQTASLFSGLAAGDYTIVITDANGCEFTQGITIETLVPTRELEPTHAITVYPNPSELGAFWVKVEGLEDLYNELNVQVVDIAGRPIIYESLTRMDGCHKGMISLYNYPAGIYYIRFQNESMNELIKIVRL